jgi:hypothetical protein
MAHPPFMPLVLSEQPPTDLVKGQPRYRGSKQHYGLLRYGSDTSPQVVIVVDQRLDGEFNLYVNAHRHLDITAEQLIPGEGRLRRAGVASEITYLDRVADVHPRQVAFRRGIFAGSIGVATLGYLEGKVNLDGQTIAARRVDGDANGLFADPRDRIWLDLNSDGQWDAFGEQFPVQPVLVLDGHRYAVRTDQAGSRLALEEITGVGTLKLQLALLSPGTMVRSIEVGLMGDDGSAYAARSDGEAVTVPVGKYAVRSLRLSLTDSQSTRPWNFQFSRYQTPHEDHWHHVAADQEVTLDPCGPLNLTLEGEELKHAARPGATITVHPRLYTAERLLINSSDFHTKPGELGDTSNQNCALVTLCQADGTRVGEHTSGFA